MSNIGLISGFDDLNEEQTLALLTGALRFKNAEIIIKNINEALDVDGVDPMDYFGNIGESSSKISKPLLGLRNKFLKNFFKTMQEKGAQCTKLEMSRDHKDILSDGLCIESCWDDDLVRIIRICKDKGDHVFVSSDNQIYVRDIFYAYEQPTAIVIIPRDNMFEQLAQKGLNDPNWVAPPPRPKTSNATQFGNAVQRIIEKFRATCS